MNNVECKPVTKSLDSFKSKKTITAGGTTYTYYSLPEAAKNGLGDVSKGDFPVKTEIALETVERLNAVSEASGVPAIRLLRLCLLRLTAEQPKPRGRRSKRTTKKAAPKRRTRKPKGE